MMRFDIIHPGSLQD